jgi:hypothetical protein
MRNELIIFFLNQEKEEERKHFISWKLGLQNDNSQQSRF